MSFDETSIVDFCILFNNFRCTRFWELKETRKNVMMTPCGRRCCSWTWATFRFQAFPSHRCLTDSMISMETLFQGLHSLHRSQESNTLKDHLPNGKETQLGFASLGDGERSKEQAAVDTRSIVMHECFSHVFNRSNGIGIWQQLRMAWRPITSILSCAPAFDEIPALLDVWLNEFWEHGYLE